MKRERLSIDVLPTERKLIKSYAAAHGQTVKELMLEAINEKILRDNETTELNEMTFKINSALGELWNNNEDADYDKL